MSGATVDRVKAACEACFAEYQSDCSGFARAVAAKVGVPLEGQANEIVQTLRSGDGWTKLSNGPAAAQAAAAGSLVVAGLMGSEQAQPDAHGHVVVVVAGPLNRNAYPSAYWGRLGGVGEKDMTINWAWTAADRDRITYAEHPLGGLS